MKQLLLIIIVILSFQSRASHVMGGDITWTCQGGDYVFQLVFYRDCNGPDINTISAQLKVWNHPTVSQITANFISREDLSPICTEVPSGPLALNCGAGPNAGNGVGAIEKVVYRSAPIALAGVPPVEGWVITYEDFSRSNSLTNITLPSSVGITLSAIIYNVPNNAGGCIDNSPQFLQDPYFVSCVGDTYQYNMNAIDPDLDSLDISFGIPYDHFPSATTYNPGISPAAINFESGFTYDSPTPGVTMNAGNIPAAVDPLSGNLTFLSNNIGNFNVKIVARSFRNGVLISQVEREMQLVVAACSGNNNAPVINGPFGGLFETTVIAGTPVNFTLTSTDLELLQDGSPQSNILTATGPMFGTPYTSNTGCAISPCASLDSNPSITGVQGVSADFSWQTTCDHLVNPQGYAADLIPYHFVFKVQDDYCAVPKVKYATITINVVNPGVIQAPLINCIQGGTNGDITISWDPVLDPFGSFVSYEVYSVQNGLEGTITNLNAGSLTIPNVTQQNDYYIAVNSGCNGNTQRYSDTISNIFLDVTNPGNGTAVLQWNDPILQALSTMDDKYYIYREYPNGTWILRDSTSFGVTNYIDTIDICSAFLNYQIILQNTPCNFTSNIDGDNFEDMINPDIPVISYVSIDTLSGDVQLSWNQNAQPDTYGYVIYVMDNNGFIIELDTVWGVGSTSYSYNTPIDGPMTYSVAAFDSCWTSTIPPTYQTSAKAELHTTMFVQSSLNICDRSVTLSWSDYLGWATVESYKIFAHKAGEPWLVVGTTSSTSFTVEADQLFNYCFVVQANHADGLISFSNMVCEYINAATTPAFNYLTTATVNDENVELRYYVDATNVSQISLQRMDETGSFAEIAILQGISSFINYVDVNADVNGYSYIYRAQVYDSCGSLGAISNEAKTILLEIDYDEVLKENYLQWSPYRDFDGSLIYYNIYRGIDGIFDPIPLATVGNNQWSYVDNTMEILSTGRICYKVEAVESTNSYGLAETSKSNEVCVVVPPSIYIPNAFFPEGQNKLFYPVIRDFDPVEYEFIVFDRWGTELFYSNDPTEAWDGVIQKTGKMATPGTYLYVLILNDGNGEEVVTRGHVSLIQ